MQRFDQEPHVSMVHPRHVSPWCLSRQKRCFDLVASVSLLTLSSPVMLLIGCLIKISSDGPVLFRQERVGLHQQPFVILKFRTMQHSVACSSSLTVTRQGDPRITALGAMLRRLKLDELPQLINVARGEMSLVGPRPKLAMHENLCMLCRPGITGAATTLFADEEALLAEVPAELAEHYVTSILNPQKCRMDSRYIETAHFIADLRILAETVFKLGQRSANPSVRVMAKPQPVQISQGPTP